MSAVISQVDLTTDDVSDFVCAFNVSVSGLNTEFTTSATFSGTIQVCGIATFSGVVSFTDSVGISGTLTTTGSTTFSANILVQDSAVFSASTDFKGSANFSGVVSFLNSVGFSDTITVVKSAIFSNSITVQTSARLSGPTTFHNVASFQDSAGFSGYVTFGDSVVFSASVQFLGPRILNVTSITTTYNISANDTLVLVDASGGDFTLSLLSAGLANAGQVVIVKRTDEVGANSVLVSAGSGETIDGQSTITLLALEAYPLTTNGTSWFII